MPARLRVLLAAAALALLALAPDAWAAPGVTISMISSPSLTLDSNKPCQEGPQAAYVAFRVQNTSGAALTNLRATLGGFASGIVLGGTSGLNPQAATQYIGRMDPGTSRVLYWYLEYACNTVGSAANLTVTVTDDTPGSTVSVASAGRVTTTSMISSQAGGVLQSGTLGAGAVVGQTITFDVAYEFGGASQGDTYNFQVAGNKNFNARCFQLTKMEVLSSEVPGAPAGQTDNPFFAAPGNQGGSKIPITMRYYFKYLCANTLTNARPYANQNSGGQLKYSSNYENFAGGIGPQFPGATNPFTVAKTVSPTVLAKGGEVTYTITVTNPSAYDAEMDSIVDILPVGVSYLAAGAPTDVNPLQAGSVPAANATGRIVWRGVPGTSFRIARNSTFTVRYTARVQNVAGSYTNTVAAYAGVTQLGTAGLVSATVTVGAANLSIVKTAPAQLSPRDSVRYVITVTNAGPLAATDVVVTDTLPAGTTFGRATGSPTRAGQVLTWPAIPSLAVNATRTDTVVLAPSAAGTIANVAAVTALTPDTLTANNRSRVETVVGVADLSIVKTGPAQVIPGDSVRYVITVTNAGPLTANDVVVTDTLPAGATFKRGTRSPVQAGQVLTWPALATLAPNATRTDTVVLFAPGTAGTLANVAAVTAPTPDTILANNRSRAESLVGLADLSVTKTAASTAIAGDSVRYVITVTNAGPSAAVNVVVTDTLPAGVTFVRATRSPTLAGRVLTWPAIASLAANTPRVDTVVVLAPMAFTTLTNIAAGTTSTLDTVPGNNNGTQPASRPSTTLTSSVSVTPDGLPTPTPRLQNGAYTQQFTVINLSATAGVYRLAMRATTGSAAGVFVTVDSVTGPGITAGGSYAAASIPLPARGQQDYTVWYRVAAGDTAVNTQFMRAVSVADTLLRDDGFAEVARVRPVVTLTKGVSPQGMVAVGTDLTYTMNVSNVGGFAARDVVLTDSVPDRVDFRIGSVTQTLPNGLTAQVEYLNAQMALITPGAGTCSPPVPSGYDRCVRWVRWRITGDLPPSSAPAAGQFRFVARIR